MRLPITLLFASGCVFPGMTDDGRAEAPTGPEAPTTATPAPSANGTFQVASHVEITIEALLPEPAAELVATMREFSVAPAHTLLDLAEDAGVPAVGTLRAVLPGALEDRLEGWIDAEIAKRTIEGRTIPQLAGELVSYAETTLTQVSIESELSIAGPSATHALTALDLAPAGLDLRVELGGVAGELLRTTATATTARDQLVLGAHTFSIAYGYYAWQAVEATVTAELGTGVRATLGAAVDCPRVAAAVASKCVLGVCVGHATELTSICERGLDEVVDRARARLTALRFDALQLSSGTATMVDVDHDQQADRLNAGVWTARINAGQGLRPAPATFTATR